MPTIEILSPLSETCVPTTFTVDGEDDLPREVKKNPDGTLTVVTPYELRLEYRESNTTGAWLGTFTATFLADGTWTCQMTLTSGHNYDIRATLWQNGMATAEVDLVYTIQVMAMPFITINPLPPPPPGPFAVAAGPAREFTGTSLPKAQLAGEVSCVVLRYAPKRRLLLPMGKHVANTGRVPSTGDWFVNPPPKLVRPKGGQKTLVLVAQIEDANGEVVASCSRVIRK